MIIFKSLLKGPVKAISRWSRIGHDTFAELALQQESALSKNNMSASLEMQAE